MYPFPPSVGPGVPAASGRGPPGHQGARRGDLVLLGASPVLYSWACIALYPVWVAANGSEGCEGLGSRQSRPCPRPKALPGSLGCDVGGLCFGGRVAMWCWTTRGGPSWWTLGRPSASATAPRMNRRRGRYYRGSSPYRTYCCCHEFRASALGPIRGSLCNSDAVGALDSARGLVHVICSLKDAGRVPAEGPFPSWGRCTAWRRRCCRGRATPGRSTTGEARARHHNHVITTTFT
jgi:hypothetical protein